jgi:hypothetical protein
VRPSTVTAYSSPRVTTLTSAVALSMRQRERARGRLAAVDDALAAVDDEAPAPALERLHHHLLRRIADVRGEPSPAAR